MSSDAAPHVVEDFFGVVRLLSDGSVVRGDESVLMPAGPLPDVPGVELKDVAYDAARGLKVRVYRSSAAARGTKLPVLVYFHGGGYCIGAHDKPMFHSFCQRFAAELPAVVLSVQYRLAPEHRLPAPIDDGVTFIFWLQTQATAGAAQGAEPWLQESADFAETFVSAGANLAHHVVVHIASGKLAVHPARIAGYVLLSAFFGSAECTAAESELPTNVSLTASMDQIWRMVLPAGATRDHPLANPFARDSPGLEPLPLPPALVVVPGLDTLRDHMRRYAARLEEMGKAVELAEFAGERHGFSVRGWSKANEELVRVLKRFVNQGATRAELR